MLNKNPQGFVLLAVLLCLSAIVSPLSAFSLSNVIIVPSENIVTGDQLSASFTFKPSVYENYTHNPGNTIQIATKLDDPVWTRITVLNDAATITQTTRGNTVNIEGWDLAYPLGTGEWINITLTGKAPQVQNTSTVTIVGIGEYDRAGKILPGTVTKFNKVVISKTDLDSGIHLAEIDLKILRSHIDNSSKKGFDISGAEAIYKEAQSGISFVRSLPGEKYSIALIRLDTVRASIKTAEDMLEKVQTQAEIDKITAPKSQLDPIIQWFKNNSGNYPGLKNITDNQTAINNLIKGSVDAMNSGQYALARAQAQEGYIVANQTYNDALALQKRARDPLTPLWDNLWIIWGILAVLVLYLLFRKKKRRPKKKKREVKDGTGKENKEFKNSSKESQESTRRIEIKKS